jgi:haloalkane dehalogenase
MPTQTDRSSIVDGQWIDREEYPFASHYADLPSGRMHYVDEGTGPVIVMVHGTPTWSFMYRHLIKGHAPHFRCIAPDNIGFGLSEHPSPYSLRTADHARNLGLLIEHLNLQDVTLIVQDFGGPIGLGYALDHRANVRAQIISNTWLWSFPKGTSQYRTLQVMGGPVGRWLYTRLNFSARVILRAAWGDKSRWSSSLHDQYLRAFPTPRSRESTHRFAQETLQSGPWYDELWSQRQHIADKPTLLVWGRKDPAFGTALERWTTLFPHAQTVEYPDAGHFTPDERGPELVPVIKEFIDRLPQEYGEEIEASVER